MTTATLLDSEPTVGMPSLPGASLQRARGEALVAVRRDGEVNRLDGLRQAGSAKVRLPRVPRQAPLEAILLNTAGGVTGGDRFSATVNVGADAHMTVSTQAAEKAYRSPGGVGEIDNHLTVEAGGRLDWIPQETILFEGSALRRRLMADLAPDAVLLAAETVVLGRTAMGEELRDIHFMDQWQIRRGGRLVFADGSRILGDSVGIMGGGATGNRARAFATIVLVEPGVQSRLEPVRALLADQPVEAGTSVWNDMLVARMVSADSQELRLSLMMLIKALRGVDMPRVWNC